MRRRHLRHRQPRLLQGHLNPIGRRVAVRAASAAATLAAVLIGGATPASAHAVLLNADPPPGTTWARPPPLVRLQFSESVEVPFGRISVVDNDGRDVTAGRLSRRPGGHEVDVAIRPPAGTVWVSWQVVSGDGHAVSGNYSFFVGGPSRTPRHNVATLSGAPASTGWASGVARFAWFAALMVLVGLLGVWHAVVRPSSLGEEALGAARGRYRAALAAAGAIAVVSGAAALIGQSAVEGGLAFWRAASVSSLRESLHTAAGRGWLAGALLALAALVAVALARRRPESRVVALVLGALLAAEAGVTAANGHARTLGRAAVSVPALAVHLLAAGLWAGGLAALLVLGAAAWHRTPPGHRAGAVHELVARFGAVAATGAAALVATGLVETVFDLGHPSDLVSLPYGRVVLVKIVLVEVALVLGARHLWFVPRQLTGEGAAATSATAGFRRSSTLELGVLALAVLAGTALAVMQPGRSVALAASRVIDQRARLDAYTVELGISPDQPGDAQLTVTFADPRGVPARAVTTATALVGQYGGAAVPIPVVWTSDGRFTGVVTLNRPGRYWAEVGAGGGGHTVTFHFNVNRSSGA